MLHRFEVGLIQRGDVLAVVLTLVIVHDQAAGVFRRDASSHAHIAHFARNQDLTLHTVGIRSYRGDQEP